jgi:hypothetical protein
MWRLGWWSQNRGDANYFSPVDGSVGSRLKSSRFPSLAGMAAYDPGCVKTLEAVASAQQKNRIWDLGESFVRERHSVRINLAPERAAEWFSHSQDPERSWHFMPVA